VPGHDPYWAHARDRVTPDRGFSPHMPHLRARVLRDRRRCLATACLGQGKTPPCDSLPPCHWGLAPRRLTAWDRRVLRAREAPRQPHKAVTASGDQGFLNRLAAPSSSEGERHRRARPGSSRVPSSSCTPPWGGASSSSPVSRFSRRDGVFYGSPRSGRHGGGS